MLKNDETIKAIIEKAREIRELIAKFNAEEHDDKITDVGVYDPELWKDINIKFHIRDMQKEDVEQIVTMEKLNELCAFVDEVEFYAFERREESKNDGWF